jgi:hypothetical protein
MVSFMLSPRYSRSWVGPRAGLDACGEENISCPFWEFKLDSAIVQPLALALYRMSYLGSENKCRKK